MKLLLLGHRHVQECFRRPANRGWAAKSAMASKSPDVELRLSRIFRTSHVSALTSEATRRCSRDYRPSGGGASFRLHKTTWKLAGKGRGEGSRVRLRCSLASQVEHQSCSFSIHLGPLGLLVKVLQVSSNADSSSFDRIDLFEFLDEVPLPSRSMCLGIVVTAISALLLPVLTARSLALPWQHTSHKQMALF